MPQLCFVFKTQLRHRFQMHFSPYRWVFTLERFNAESSLIRFGHSKSNCQEEKKKTNKAKPKQTPKPNNNHQERKKWVLGMGCVPSTVPAFFPISFLLSPGTAEALFMCVCMYTCTTASAPRCAKNKLLRLKNVSTGLIDSGAQPLPSPWPSLYPSLASPNSRSLCPREMRARGRCTLGKGRHRSMLPSSSVDQTVIPPPPQHPEAVC